MTNLNQLRFQAKHIKTEIAFDPKWSNGTGYFDHAVTADLGLTPGQVVKTECPAGRLLVLVGTRFGNVVFFERYSPETNDGEIEYSHVVVANSPTKLRALVGTGRIDASVLCMMAVEYCNIGLTIEQLFHEGF